MPKQRRLPALSAARLWTALLLLYAALLTLAAPAAPSRVQLLTIDTAIGPGNADYVVRGLAQAAASDVAAVVLQIDTPGGLDAAMRDIVSAILHSEKPVLCLVAPAGARAASAGTYILYACHIAAMAPATHLGAASPVAIGGRGSGEDGQADEGGERGTTTMERKALNDAVAYIRSLATLRGRNADWAEQAVREAATLTAAEALQQGVIDLVVPDVAALLEQSDGRSVQVTDEAEMRLATAGALVEAVEPDWRQRFLTVITDPNVAYILMMIGIYGLLLEFYSPGVLVPGVAGAICLLLALYAFQVLPISYSGLGLLLLGIALMIAEAVSPSFGVLGLGGVAAFVAGSVLLFDASVPGLRLALPVVAAFAVVSLGAVLVLIGAAVRGRRQAPVNSLDDWVGTEARAAETFVREGLVQIRGELWRARSSALVQRGQRVRVTAVDDFVLTVEPVEDPSTVQGEAR
jgi:membrane-bound serine protease (ClpP class)